MLVDSGVEVDESPAPLIEVLPLADPEPANPEIWVREARSKSPSLEARRQAIVVSDREIDIQRSAHFPTVDFRRGACTFCGACATAWDEIISHQLDAGYRPCNLVELMPRFRE